MRGCAGTWLRNIGPYCPSRTCECGVSESILKLDRVSRTFGRMRAVHQVTLEIQEGEIFALLGPSGCGKSTTLRLVTGLERPDEGDIYIRDKVVASVTQRIFIPPHKRSMGMVFQSYAIWPHLTVFENVAYPLRALGIRGTELRERVLKVLAVVGLQGLEDRPGPLLSGGQQQRVALARALVYEPAILLLDEPFSNLDTKMREQMRVETKLLQRRLGVTVLIVTHDQVEALSLADRIAVMESGQVMQVGAPQEIYEKPKTPFVRDFLGKSVVLEGQITRLGPEHQLEVMIAGDLQRPLLVQDAIVPPASVGQRVSVAIRPEDIQVEDGQSSEACNRLEGTITALLFLGERYECHVQLGQEPIVLYFPRPIQYREGQTIRLHFPATALTAWKQ